MTAAVIEMPLNRSAQAGARPTEPVEYPSYADAVTDITLPPRVGPTRRVHRPQGMPLPSAGAAAPPQARQVDRANVNHAYDAQTLPPEQLGRDLPLPPAPKQGEQRGLPDAHQLFHCGPRQVYWSSRVPVLEDNCGVLVHTEFPTRPEHAGALVSHHDDAIRNVTWTPCGEQLPKVIPPQAEGMTQWVCRHADYYGALDVKGLRKQEMRGAPPQERHSPDYYSLNASRNDGLLSMGELAREKLRREVLDEQGMREFFSDPAAVSYEHS